MKGKLYLIPVPISEGTAGEVLSPQLRSILPGIRCFMVENARTARRFLSSLKIYESIEPLHFDVLDKDTPEEALATYFEPLTQGVDAGVLSESGCPGIADPGAIAVRYAHENGFEVVPLVGPSSLLLALMASGLNGQRFAFHGYLPIDEGERSRTIRELERESRSRRQTQLFIETPYRNNAMMASLLKNLSETTLLTVALDLTGAEQYIRTDTIRRWKANRREFAKLPAVFLFLAP